MMQDVAYLDDVNASILGRSLHMVSKLSEDEACELLDPVFTPRAAMFDGICSLVQTQGLVTQTSGWVTGPREIWFEFNGNTVPLSHWREGEVLRVCEVRLTSGPSSSKAVSVPCSRPEQCLRDVQVADRDNGSQSRSGPSSSKAVSTAVKAPGPHCDSS
mmetsp:Transcript_103342/g.182121  ORF Transcript_103342/g.182121 Transcript_103342/m.182121 type:complete len:159 (-) Transcript_103342:24-500(-)